LPFPGTHPARDGAEVRLVIEPPTGGVFALLRDSVNFSLVERRACLPTIPTSEQKWRAADASRQRSQGIWASDSTISGFTVNSADDLTERLVILPKLFRRFIDYLALNDGDISLAPGAGRRV
jgi:hypothetical protein